MRYLVMLFATVLLGCSRSDVPNERYFSGEPVDHWLKSVKSPDPKIRRKATEVLGNVGPVDPRAVPALIDALKDTDARVRDSAVLSLSKIGTPAASAESVLEEATKDLDPNIRSHAKSALVRIRGAR